MIDVEQKRLERCRSAARQPLGAWKHRAWDLGFYFIYIKQHLYLFLILVPVDFIIVPRKAVGFVMQFQSQFFVLNRFFGLTKVQEIFLPYFLAQTRKFTAKDRTFSCKLKEWQPKVCNYGFDPSKCEGMISCTSVSLDF